MGIIESLPLQDLGVIGSFILLDHLLLYMLIYRVLKLLCNKEDASNS